MNRVAAIMDFMGLAQRPADWRLATTIIIATELVLAVVLVGPFLVYNNLENWDMIGHWASAEYTARYLWPWPFGWNPWFYAGAPQNELYPPLLAWLTATLGQVMGVKAALKLIVAASVLTTPLTFNWLARSVGAGRVTAALASLAAAVFLCAPHQPLNGTFEATFEVGNLANTIAIPLAFVHAASLADMRAGRGGVILPTLSLAALICGHLVLGEMMILYALVDAVWSAARSGWNRHQILLGAAHLGGAFVLSAWFALPFVWRLRRYGAPDIRSFDDHYSSGPEIAATYAVLVAVFAAPRAFRRRIAVPAIFAGLIFSARIFVFDDALPSAVVVRPYRFKLLEHLLVWLAASCVLGKLASSRLSGRVRARLGWGAGGLGVVALAVAAFFIAAGGVADQAVPALDGVHDRALVISSKATQTSDHAMQHLVPLRDGVCVTKGLFVESAANARALGNLERIVSHPDYGVRLWSIGYDPFEALGPATDHWASLLERFGVGHILATEPINPRIAAALPAPRELGDGVQIYELEPPALVEVMGQWPRPVAADAWEQEAIAWFLAGGVEEILGGGTLPPEHDAAPRGNIRDLSISPGQDHLRFVIDAPHPVPVLVKIPYYPNWHAYDESGARLPVYRAAPYLTAVIARGPVELRYEATTAGRLVCCVSLLALMALAAWLVTKHTSRWAPGRRRGARALALVAALVIVGAGSARGLIAPPGPLVASEVSPQ